MESIALAVKAIVYQTQQLPQGQLIEGMIDAECKWAFVSKGVLANSSLTFKLTS